MANAQNVAYKPRTTYKKTVRGDEATKHMVCTVWPEPISRPCSVIGGTHVNIPGRPGEKDAPQQGATIGGQPTNRYGFALVGPGINREDLGGCYTFSELGIPSRRVAMDVIGLAEPSYSDLPEPDGSYPLLAAGIATSDLFEKGYFVPEGDEPTEEEVAAAESRRQRYLANAIRKGDAAYQQGVPTSQMHPDALAAVRFLGLSRPWAPEGIEAKSKTARPCPACGKGEIELGQKKCVVCGEWLGREADGTLFAVNDPERKARAVAAKLGKE